VWSAQTVIQYLHALVNKANKAPQGGVAPFFKFAAEFSLIGLCRVNCLLGDYYGALQALETLPVDMGKRPYYDCQGILACHTTLHYYMSFAYVMLNRFGDAITTITDGIIYINRNKQFLPRSYQDAIITKKTNCMLNLLAIAVAVNPQTLDDGVNSLMKDALPESDLARMQNGDLNAFEQAFENACPKFVFGGTPDYSQPTNYLNQAFNAQVQAIVAEVSQTLPLLKLKSYLKLYSKIEISKLSRFMEVSEEEMSGLLTSYSNRLKRSNGGSYFDGKGAFEEERASGEVSFHIEGSTLVIDQVANTEGIAKTQAFFKNGIKKSVECRKDLNRIFSLYGVGN